MTDTTSWLRSKIRLVGFGMSNGVGPERGIGTINDPSSKWLKRSNRCNDLQRSKVAMKCGIVG
jgi:hypothetical protein